MARWIHYAALSGATILFALSGLGPRRDDDVGTPEWRRAQAACAEAESIRILNRATTIDRLEEAVDHLGVVFRLKDEGWLAIRYQDCHAGGIWSSAVARDSAGGWHASNYHFCGRFAGHRKWQKEPRDRDGDPDFLVIDGTDVESARKQLVRLGFRRIDGPR